MNEEPIRLKPEDSAAPADPQVVGVELMQLLQSIADDSIYLRTVLTRVGPDLMSTHSKAAHQAVDLADAAARALDAGETLMQALRAARLFSAVYEDVGVRGDR